MADSPNVRSGSPIKPDKPGKAANAAKCCYRSAIVLDFANRVTYRRCPIHGETEHMYQPPRPVRRGRVHAYRWGVALYAFGWTWGIGFDIVADSWWWPLWVADGDVRP